MGLAESFRSLSADPEAEAAAAAEEEAGTAGGTGTGRRLWFRRKRCLDDPSADGPRGERPGANVIKLFTAVSYGYYCVQPFK